jgi:hypothetical protein
MIMGDGRFFSQISVNVRAVLQPPEIEVSVVGSAGAACRFSWQVDQEWRLDLRSHSSKVQSKLSQKSVLVFEDGF